MTNLHPDTRTPEPTVRAPRVGRAEGIRRLHSRIGVAAKASNRLAELTKARNQFSAADLPRRFSVIPKLILAILACLLVGVALVLAEPFQHQCGATFKIAGTNVQHRMEFYRKELLEHAWAELANHPDDRSGSARWQVDLPAPDQLRICLTTADQQRGIDRASVLARGFLSRLNTLTHEIRTTPTESENVLSAYVSELQTRLTDAQVQLEAAIKTLPADDPRGDRDAMLAKWENLRSDFSTARERLDRAAEESNRLLAESEPTHGIVTVEERREAFLADSGLQQDLKELGATLTELKRHMLEVWRRASEPLRQAELASAVYIEDLSRRGAGELPTEIRAIVDTLAKQTAEYREAMSTFAQAWSAEFSALSHREIDPESGDVLDGYQRSRSLLNDFLFNGGQRLSSLRAEVNALARKPTDHVLHHVLQSELTRGFQELQSAHHRFEFAAGSLETPENFRLDSAIRIARGLRRRTTDQMRTLEERLQSHAADRARNERMRAVASIEDVLRATRAASDKTVDELVALQDGLNQTASLSEAFVASVLRAELANSRLQITQEDLERTQGQLLEFAARRAATNTSADLTLVSCGVVQASVNLPERLHFGAVGAGVTFLAVLLGQLLLRQRS